MYNNKQYNQRNYSNRKEERRIKAYNWTNEMEQEFSDEIDYSINNTQVYDDLDGSNRLYQTTDKTNTMTIEVVPLDTVSAIFKYQDDTSLVTLNFASFKNPGGGFINGSKAQEECLCEESFLYNVLYSFNNTFYEENRKMLNKSMYKNRALYSPQIIFLREEKNGKRIEGKEAISDVITCASPNFSSGKNLGVSKEENLKVLESRIQFILDIASINHAETLILGAFGCGVFKQDPKNVANIFKKLLPHYPFVKVVFAIPQSRKDNNYEVFKQVFEEK